MQIASPDVSPTLIELVRAVDLELSRGNLDMPVLPDVAREVVAATTDGGGDARSLADIIRRDQAMAANLLRLANSPIYRSATPTTSIQHAITRLGESRVRELALLVACHSRIFVVRGYEQVVQRLFQHSLAAALLAQEIARQKRSPLESAFMGGLLHDMGRPILLQKVVDLDVQLRTCATPQQIMAVVDARHAEVGATLAAQWGFAERLCTSVRLHHTEGAPASFTDLHVVMLADLFAHYALDPHAEGVDAEAFVRSHPSVAALGLTDANMSALFDRVPVVQQTAAEMM
jgi:putative nucleotidyltransferase with HDIG domain